MSPHHWLTRACRSLQFGTDVKEVDASCAKLVERSKKFADRDAALRLASRTHCRVSIASAFTGEVHDRDTVAVLFDFDGTLADTAAPKGEVS
eukprot:6572386-Pyramimonas_sp.AAC.1